LELRRLLDPKIIVITGITGVIIVVVVVVVIVVDHPIAS
jgi:hypothetical protein